MIIGRRIWKQVETYQGTYPNGDWVVTDTRKFVWDGWRMLAELQEIEDQDLLRWTYTWGLDLAGQMNGAGSLPGNLESAGTIGGLLAAHYHFGGGGSEDVLGAYCYDGNGNVGQLVDWRYVPSDPATAIVAKYEYDPYGNVTAQAGALAAPNHFRFSTKFWDDETGLGYWGYRYYSPTLGRWISRDPGDDRASPNLYAFVRNAPTVSVDFLGLWDARVHRDFTRDWAEGLGMTAWAAKTTGWFDNQTDQDVFRAGWGPGPFGDQRYHFSRGPSGSMDSRLFLKSRHLAIAIQSCIGHSDWPEVAAVNLGRALHAIQDWWAHGDYSKGPNDTWTPHGPGYDDWGMDAVGSQNGVAALPDGRPPQVFVGGTEVRWGSWAPGSNRVNGTSADSRAVISRFLDALRSGGNCECRKFFLDCRSN